ncbi:hypothetical protein [Paludifilum halophilum]|uniref:Citrate transporter-like domain-containing protein n=1 Tax=Paludifilum halophilum TaxID=1642702 RepID=A0A235B5J9_9BACL|nr:hypothetical protein [Paludifilum halophilum]OYD07177.1 hypothetical protein CHM34_12380 [Paludifilum halophilum]
MTFWTDRIKFTLYTAFVSTYLTNLFLESITLNRWLGILGIGCIAVSFKGANRTFQIISAIFLAAGLFMFRFTEVSWESVIAGIRSSALLLSLLYVLPFINNMIVIGRYDQQLNRLLRARAEHLGQLYYRSSLVSYILCIFLFFACIPLIYRVVQKNMAKLSPTLRHKFSSQSILRAFAVATVWSPIEVFIALVAEMTDVGYVSLLPWLLLISIVLLLADWAWGWQYKRIPLNTRSNLSVDRRIMRKIAALILSLILFIFVVYQVHHLLNLRFFTAVTLVVIPYTLVWSFVIQRFRSYVKYSFLSWRKQVPSLQNFMLLFLSLGFFNHILGEAPIMTWAQEVFLHWTQTPVFLFIGIQLSSLFLTMIGIHPLVTVSLQGILIQPLLSAMNPVSLAIVLITSNLANDAAGTFNTTVTIMSQLTKVNPYRITWWNLFFAVAYGGLGILAALLLL